MEEEEDLNNLVTLEVLFTETVERNFRGQANTIA